MINIYKTIFFVIASLFLMSCNHKPEKVKDVKSEKHQAISVNVIVPEHGMADPHAWVENGRVYIICGHDKSWDATSSFPMDRWEVWSTDDLINWEHHRNIYPSETYIGDKPNCWAGDICERDGKYYWFFSMKINWVILCRADISSTGDRQIRLQRIGRDLDRAPSIHQCRPPIHKVQSIFQSDLKRLIGIKLHIVYRDHF